LAFAWFLTVFNTIYQYLTKYRLTFGPSNQTNYFQMKTYIVLVPLLALFTATAYPLLAQSTGEISYEVVRKIDPSGMRIMINGEQIKPGDPNFPADIPDTRTYGQKALFSGQYVKENRDEQNAGVRIMVSGTGAGGAPQTTNLGRPFEEQVFVDLTNQKRITLLTVGKEKEAKTYRADTPIKRSGDWQLTDQTRKIAGYTCRKATVPFRKETYTVWFTTDLPITYSPIPDLTPETGVVLLIESSREQFKVMKVNTKSVAASEVAPKAVAQTVAMEQLIELRQKAMADFQQQLMMGER
jgi:GLPGLI family protein